MIKILKILNERKQIAQMKKFKCISSNEQNNIANEIVQIFKTFKINVKIVQNFRTLKIQH